jgi:2-methylisocitrate lyase-like PEP mutase family enzyme
MTNFRLLHENEQPFILGNVHDVHSAKIFENLGYKAVGTSSAAISYSMGLDDCENLTFEQLLAVVKSITSQVKIPLTVDIESGYSQDITIICENIKQLANLGVVGINIEDSFCSDSREIQDKNSFASKIKSIKSYLLQYDIDIFINIRTDFYIMGLENPLENTLERIKLYEDAGADGIFIPCITSETDIIKVVASTKLPINVMAMSELIDYKTLSKIGVKRISLGPFAYIKMMDDFEKDMQKILNNNSLNTLFNND